MQTRILPDLDDDLVQSASEFETVAEFRDDITERLSDAKRAQVRMLLREHVSEAVAGLVVADLPEALMTAEVDRRLGDLQQMLASQNGDLEGYLAATGQTTEELREQMSEGAEKSVRLDLGLRAVADAEALDTDDADLQADADRTAERMELDPAEVRERLDRSGGWSTLRAERRKAMALDWLMDHTTVIDPDGVPVARELLAIPQPDLAGGDEEDGGFDEDEVDTFDDDPGLDELIDLDAEGESGPEVAPQDEAETVSSTEGKPARRRRWIPRH